MLLLLLLLAAEEEEGEAILRCCGAGPRRWMKVEADNDEDVRNTKALAVVLKWLSTNMKRHKAVAVGVAGAEAAKRLGRRGFRPQRSGISWESRLVLAEAAVATPLLLLVLHVPVWFVCMVVEGWECGFWVGRTCLASPLYIALFLPFST